MNVKNVTALAGYKLHVAFDDGVTGIIDLSNFIGSGIFSSLRGVDKFNQVYSNGYSIAWSDELEIDALTVYAEIVNKNPEDILNVNTYATN